MTQMASNAGKYFYTSIEIIENRAALPSTSVLMATNSKAAVILGIRACRGDDDDDEGSCVQLYFTETTLTTSSSFKRSREICDSWN